MQSAEATRSGLAQAIAQNAVVGPPSTTKSSSPAIRAVRRADRVVLGSRGDKNTRNGLRGRPRRGWEVRTQ